MMLVTERTSRGLRRTEFNVRIMMMDGQTSSLQGQRKQKNAYERTSSLSTA